LRGIQLALDAAEHEIRAVVFGMDDASGARVSAATGKATALLMNFEQLVHDNPDDSAGSAS
jgi:hypothetical protein